MLKHYSGLKDKEKQKRAKGEASCQYVKRLDLVLLGSNAISKLSHHSRSTFFESSL